MSQMRVRSAAHMCTRLTRKLGRLVWELLVDLWQVLQGVVGCCSVMQCVCVLLQVLQGVLGCCSVLQCVCVLLQALQGVVGC